MNAELKALEVNHNWDIVPWSKWVYSIKLHSDGSLERYKAQLVALGMKSTMMKHLLPWLN